MNTKHKNWYKDSYKTIKKVYFNDSDLFIGLLSATSPRKNVKANWNLAHKIYLNVISGLNPFDDVQGYLKAHVNNVYRAIKGQQLSGLKVENFRQALLGNLNAVVIDTWILKYFHYSKDSITPLQYKIMSKKIKANARKHSLKPVEYQAVIWEKIRSRHGFKPVSFASIN